jgi:SUKH-3 immunity protein
MLGLRQGNRIVQPKGTEIMSRFNEFVEGALKRAGWSPNRRITGPLQDWETTLEASDGFRLFPAARKVLSEFGGLKIEQWNPGRTKVHSVIDLRPTLAEGESDRFQAYSDILGVELYPLGEVDGGHGFLAIATDEKTYTLMDEIWFEGATFDDALNKLVQGRYTEPLRI